MAPYGEITTTPATIGMGGFDVQRVTDSETLRAFTRAVIRDIRALERMLEEDRIERGVRRIGAEQELFLIDAEYRPAMAALEVIEAADDARFTTEIGLFNIEANLAPLDVTRDVLGRFHAALRDVVDTAEAAARAAGVRTVMTGILPTLDLRDLTLDAMTPRDRYHALNDVVMAAGGPVRLRLQGTDELLVEHDNVMLEACTTSLQLHLQVDPGDFAAMYNVAQLLAAPVLAACVNSPLFLGRRLWKETRIALFHQSIDTSGLTKYPREPTARVWFGDGWVESSVAELFRENVTRFRPLLMTGLDDDPFAALAAGRPPALRALQLHNGTVYRWNRPCYGIHDGTAHLRIECRYLPAGPTVIDEVANAAFWLGAMVGGRRLWPEPARRLRFELARANFVAAARLGLDAGFTWLDGERLGAGELVLDRILPAARLGLRELGVDESQAEHYLHIIERRVATGATGADWLLRSDLALSGMGRARRLSALAAALYDRMLEDTPVHEWDPPEDADSAAAYACVEHCMTADLLTLRDDDAVDLAAFIMDDRGVRQILVEDADQRLVGVISYRSLLKLLASGRIDALSSAVPVRDVMVRDPVTVRPETPTLDALRLLRDRNLTALPVTRDGRLLGILSERDLLPVLARLLEERLPANRPVPSPGTRP